MTNKELHTFVGKSVARLLTCLMIRKAVRKNE